MVHKAPATGKINLALVVGPQRADGKHEVLTVLQRIALADRVSVVRADRLSVDGFAGDTLVRRALERLADAAAVEPLFAAQIWKRLPVSAGLGGGSSDAATALRLANTLLETPLGAEQLDGLARGLGSDVPFFLRQGPQLGSGDGSMLVSVDLPQEYWIVLCAPDAETKESTAAVYRRFDERGGADGFEARRACLMEAVARIRSARDLALLPTNDLAASTLSSEMLGHGALRADVSGAGTAVYGVFLERLQAEGARRAMRAYGRTWLTRPCWYR